MGANLSFQVWRNSKGHSAVGPPGCEEFRLDELACHDLSLDKTPSKFARNSFVSSKFLKIGDYDGFATGGFNRQVLIPLCSGHENRNPQPLVDQV